jgi:hypothetical protein
VVPANEGRPPHGPISVETPSQIVDDGASGLVPQPARPRATDNAIRPDPIKRTSRDVMFGVMERHGVGLLVHAMTASEAARIQVGRRIRIGSVLPKRVCGAFDTSRSGAAESFGRRD